MGQAVLLIGGNLGDREKLIEEAETQISGHMDLLLRSSIYETAAWGGQSKGNYLNRALVVRTGLSPIQLLDTIQQIETDLGRVRKEKWGDRTMDIDIIYMDGLQLSTDRLTLPHPRMAQRKFVLVPLAEVLPDFPHPVTGQTSTELLAACPDDSYVEKWSK